MKPVLALIITEEVTLQDGLVALLTTIPGISAVMIAEKYATGLRMLSSHSPGLAVVDMSLQNNGAAKLIRQIKDELPGTKTIVLTDSPQQSREAEKLNAERTLHKGFPPHILIKMTEELLV